MQEGNELSACPGPRTLVQKLQARATTGFDGCAAVFHPQRQVMKARPAFRQESSHRCVGSGGLEKLQMSAAQLEDGHLHAVAVHGLHVDELEPQQIAIKNQGLLQVM